MIVALLEEVSRVPQHPGEHRRRWFASDTLDLIVWSDASGKLIGFQLCYDKDRDERAVMWNVERWPSNDGGG